MPVEYEYDPNSNIVCCNPSGKLTFHEVSCYFDNIAKDNRIGSEFIEVVYFEATENFMFSSEEAEGIINKFNKLKRDKKIKATILIGSKDLHYGMARMMQSLLNVYIPEHASFAVHNNREAKETIKKVLDNK